MWEGREVKEGTTCILVRELTAEDNISCVSAGLRVTQQLQVWLPLIRSQI